MSDCIAQRQLLYATKDQPDRREFVIRIGTPYLVDQSKVNFTADEGVAGCTVDFDGLPEVTSETVYGADLLQALQLAVNIEPILKRLSRKYDFYFPTGERYFENEDLS